MGRLAENLRNAVFEPNSIRAREPTVVPWNALERFWWSVVGRRSVGAKRRLCTLPPPMSCSQHMRDGERSLFSVPARP